MKHQTISTTELARNVAMSIDQVRISGQALDITKGSQVVAALVPPPKPSLPVQALAEVLSTLPLLDDKANNFAEDIAVIKTRAKLPDSPWD